MFVCVCSAAGCLRRKNWVQNRTFSAATIDENDGMEIKRDKLSETGNSNQSLRHHKSPQCTELVSSRGVKFLPVRKVWRSLYGKV